MNYDRIVKAIELSGKKYLIYELYDLKTGEVKYIGRTGQDIITRLKQHWDAPLKNGLGIRPAKYKKFGKIKELICLTWDEMRGFEHLVYEKALEDKHVLLKSIKPMREAYSKFNSKGYHFIQAAEEFMKRLI